MKHKLQRLITWMTCNYAWHQHTVFTLDCPNHGYYGVNCSTPCPDPNCRYCHIETGACQGCKPGYRGNQCEQGNCPTFTPKSFKICTTMKTLYLMLCTNVFEVLKIKSHRLSTCISECFSARLLWFVCYTVTLCFVCKRHYLWW